MQEVSRMRPRLNLLLLFLLPLLLTVRCLPTDQLVAEGSGDDVMLNDAPGNGVLTLESVASDIEQTGQKDELFHSLADLLTRMQELEGAEPETETDQELEQEAEPEAEQEVEPEAEQEAEPEAEQEAEPESEQEAEPEAEQETEPQQEPEQEQKREEETAYGPDQELEEESEQDTVQQEKPTQEEDPDQEQEPEQQEQESEQELAGTKEPESGTTVLPVQLLDLPVVPEPADPDETPADTSSAPEETPVAPAGEPLEQNEVPLPTPGLLPVQEPLIVAETATCLGCVTPILQDSADLRRIANMAAKLLEEELDSRFTFRVTEVYRASKQVVNGIKYFLTLEVAPTSCERPHPPFTLCFVTKDAPRLLYSVEILHQPHRANTELLNLRKMDHSQVARFSGLFAATTAEPPTEAPSRPAAPIAPSDSLLDILIGLDSVISRQRGRQDTEEQGEAGPAGPPPLQADMAGPPPLQAEPPLQADWQAGVQQRHSTSQQALQVQALLREAGWQGPRPGQAGQRQQEQLEPEEEEEEIVSGCRTARQHDIQQVPLNVAHPRVQKILLAFLESQERAGSQRLVITDIQSATRQTIAETNYRFEFVLGVSECLKNSTAHRYSCSATGTHPLSDCRVRARQRPGQPLQFNSISCSSKRQPHCANGHCQDREIHPYAPVYIQSPKVAVEVDIHDSAYQQLVYHVQDEVNRRSRRPFLKKFVRTLNATKVSYNLQETSEITDQELFSLTLRFVETGCPRTGVPGTDQLCLRQWKPSAASGDRPTSVCDVRVSSLGWADRMRVLDLFCETEVEPTAA